MGIDGFPGGKLFYDVSSLPSYQALADGETATDTITYTIADRWYGKPGHSAETTTGIGQVVVTIEGVNDAPIALNDHATTDEDTPLDIAVLANDSDPDRSDRLQVARINGQSLSFGNPVVLASGALVGLTVDGRLRYDPASGFAHLAAGEKAADSFTYTVSDGHGGFADATVSLIVAGLNDAPVAGPDATHRRRRPWRFRSRPRLLLANDFDPDAGDLLHVISADGTRRHLRWRNHFLRSRFAISASGTWAKARPSDFSTASPIKRARSPKPN